MNEFIYIENGIITITSNQKPQEEEQRIVRNGGFAICRDHMNQWSILQVNMETIWRLGDGGPNHGVESSFPKVVFEVKRTADGEQ